MTLLTSNALGEQARHISVQLGAVWRRIPACVSGEHDTNVTNEWRKGEENSKRVRCSGIKGIFVSYD